MEERRYIIDKKQVKPARPPDGREQAGKPVWKIGLRLKKQETRNKIQVTNKLQISTINQQT